MVKADLGAITKNQGGFQSNIGCNSTITALAGGATFTGMREKSAYPHVMVSVEADQAGTLFFEFSDDGENWITTPSAGFSVLPNIHKQIVMIKGPRFTRIKFENTSERAQAILRLYTYFGFFALSETTIEGGKIVIVDDNLQILAGANSGTTASPFIQDVKSDRLEEMLNSILQELKIVNLYNYVKTDVHFQNTEVE